MPQLDILTFKSQYILISISFIIFYLLLSIYILPAYLKILKIRNSFTNINSTNLNKNFISLITKNIYFSSIFFLNNSHLIIKLNNLNNLILLKNIKIFFKFIKVIKNYFYNKTNKNIFYNFFINLYFYKEYIYILKNYNDI